MYSSKKNVQVLVALLKEHNVRHAVISPGSRNMALVVSLENDPFFTCHSVVDERSASYFAIGVSLAHNEPVLLSCTSAQATRNYIPGMTEAYYRGVPLVFITADYKPSQIGQGTMQALEQMSIPRDSAKVSVQLPIVKDADDEAFCVRLVNEALLGLRHHGSGPVHIDLPIEEHWDGGVVALPPVRKLERHTSVDTLPTLTARRILVAIGQHPPFTPEQSDALDRFAATYGAVVYTNHLSNYDGPNAVNAPLLIENMNSKRFVEYQHDLLITIGGQIGDYGFDSLARRTPVEHWRVNEDGLIQDTYGRLSKVFEMGEVDFFGGYADLAGSATRANSGYVELWAKANAQRSIPAELPLSHAFIAAELSPRIPEGSVMHFAILSALRNWNFFPLHDSIACYSNVAAFGIDGCLSTFMGHAVATDRMAFLVIGDLSFFYDMNALGIRGVTPNARIVLVNNNGGGEFRLYSNAADQFGEDANRHIAAAGHNGSAKGWVESMGWEYTGIRSKEEFRESIERFLEPSERPMLMEVFTNMHDDSEGVRMIRQANSIESLEQRIKKILPPEVKRVAKRVLGR